MIPNIIHLVDRMERMKNLERIFIEQGIKEYKFWDGILGPEKRCTLIAKAHKQIVRWAKENNMPEVLIWEDDIQFYAPDAHDYFLRSKPEDFDVYLGGIYRGNIREDGTLDRFTGLHQYIVHQRFYDTFLEVTESYDLDHAISGTGGKFKVCYPFASTQTAGWSDNVMGYADYSADSVFFKDRLIYGK